AKRALDWSPDGRSLLFINRGDASAPWRLWILPMDGDRKPFMVRNSSFGEFVGEFSPDGRWIAFSSIETGRHEIYVRSFPGPGGQWAISTAGGVTPKWRADGKELYYIAPDGTLIGAPISVQGTTIVPGTPVALFKTHIAYGGTLPGGGIGRQYDVAADGRF